jgi:hypothetical protein
MKDIRILEKLQEMLTSFDDTSVAYSELEDYINYLTSIQKDFLHNISNNLKLKGMKEGVLETVGKIIDGMVVLAPPSSEYNCHGWSLGTVRNIPLSSNNKKDLLEEIELYRGLKNFYDHTDKTMPTFFSIPKSILKENSNPSGYEGSILTYHAKDQGIAHTAKYLKSVKWYTYEDKYHKEWYDKDKQVIKFNEPNNCIVESYTSKLGLGYLIAHDPMAMIPLYGEIDGFYDLSESV